MRNFHLCLSPEIIEQEPELLQTVQSAGVTDIWIAGFLYGHWYYTPDRIQQARRRVERLGFASHVVNVPLGHPGDALGAKSGDVPLSPPRHWRMAERPDGSAFAGTSLHSPATEENVRAMQDLRALGVDRVFVDDDFRLAVSPGAIGGCFCAQHRDAFLRRYGYSSSQWTDLLASVNARDLTPLLRDWTAFTCDELTASFRAQQAAAPEIALGIMVMYLGAEKAGIRLGDYAGAPLRVGELMFDDTSFGRAKGKTDELFSVLFHRRYVAPQLAYSETTAFPCDQLSAANMAAKLNISLLADVRNTMFMSGLTPFPPAHWDTLAPAMRKQAVLHAQLAGHTPRGPFKHYWGEHGRCVSDDNPYSLFLAAGVPFEAIDQPGGDGWTFLGDADGAAVTRSQTQSAGTTFVTRAAFASNPAVTRIVPESLPELFAFKREVISNLRGVPFVREDVPVVCAWYPTARSVLLWNLTEQPQTLTVQLDDKQHTVPVQPLDAVLWAIE